MKRKEMERRKTKIMEGRWEKEKTEKYGKRKENCIPQSKVNSNTLQGITENTCADVDVYFLPILLA